MAADNPEFEEFIMLSGRNATYTPQYENIQEATCWEFSFDATHDCSGKELLCFLVRYVTANNEYREDYLGF